MASGERGKDAGINANGGGKRMGVSATTGGDPIVSLLRALDGHWSAGAFDKLSEKIIYKIAMGIQYG